MKVQDIVDSARDLLNDRDSASYRYSTSSLLRAISMGILELRRTRPDFFIGTYSQEIPMVQSITEDIPLPMELMPSLIHYTVGTAELRDDEYTADGRVQLLLGKLERDVGAG